MRAGPLLKPYSKDKVEHTAYFYPEVESWLSQQYYSDTMMQRNFYPGRTMIFLRRKAAILFS
jgi:hypothetical protein